MGNDNWDRINSGHSNYCPNDRKYVEEITRLEQVVHTFRSMLEAAGVKPEILDVIEDEAYNRKIV